MKIYTNVSLKPYNTFGIDVKAKELIEVTTLDELKEVVRTYLKLLPIGGGSNLLLTQPIDIPVLKVNLRGIEIVAQDQEYVWIEAQAGENWHQLVLYCLEHHYGGIENLSLIPGNVGTAPIQNIGAYGVELKDVLAWCDAIDTTSGMIRRFTNQECQFAYRESIFKTSEKGKYIITSVTLRLTKHSHLLRTNYGAINSYLTSKGITTPTIQDVSKAVIAIRQSKLPDPKVLGNSGSFFKNPVVSTTFFNKLQETYPDMPHYVISENEIKIPAGWLIESCGLKGYRKGNAGVHKNQSLVLVNYGNASGKEIYDLAQYIQKIIYDRYAITLEIEVNVI